MELLVFGLIIFAIYWVRKAKKEMHDPEKFRDYVTKKGYNTEQQKDFCKRLGIDYELVTGKSVERKHFEGKQDARKKAIDKWEETLTILWAGDAQTITIIYEDRDGCTTLRKINPEQITFSKTAEFYIRGYCHTSNEPRTFNVGGIEKIIENDGNETDFYAWCLSATEIDPFTAVPKGRLPNFYQILWKGRCAPTTFTYRDESRIRMTVTPLMLRKRGKFCDLIASDESGDTLVLHVQKIETMLATDGFKKMHFDDWVTQVLYAQG
ncbi:TPA: hypothetical protein ACGVAR_003047 [Vibrio vulnificus]